MSYGFFSLSALRRRHIRPLRACLVRRLDLVARCVAQAVEIAPAARRVPPAFGVQSLGVRAIVKEFAPFLVARSQSVRSGQMRFTRVSELDFGPVHFAIGTANEQHGVNSMRDGGRR